MNLHIIIIFLPDKFIDHGLGQMACQVIDISIYVAGHYALFSKDRVSPVHYITTGRILCLGKCKYQAILAKHIS